MPAVPAPARPGQSLPHDYDAVLIQKYGEEFEAIPLPDQDEAAAASYRLACAPTITM